MESLSEIWLETTCPDSVTLSKFLFPQVDKIPEMCDYIVLGTTFTFLISLLPVLFRAYQVKHRIVLGIAQEEILENSILLFGSHWK